MKKLVIGVTGEIASGKGTVAKCLQVWYPNVETFRYSDSLREFYAWLRNDFICQGGITLSNTEASHAQLQQLSTTIRRIFGENSLERAIMVKVKRALSVNKFVAIEGIRRIVDIETLRNDPEIDFKLIYVDVDPNVRYKRYVIRDEKPGDAGLSLGQFLHLCNAEAEAQIRDLMPHADFILHNNGTLQEFEASLRSVMNEWTV